MLPDEAYELLYDLEFDKEEASRLNPSFTRGEIHNVVVAGIVNLAT